MSSQASVIDRMLTVLAHDLCGVTEQPYRSSRSRLMCRACGRQSTVTAGTIFDKTRTPLRVWLAAA